MNPETFSMPPQPKAVITLKVADDRDKTIWVTEDTELVLARIADAKADRMEHSPMVKLSRWRAMRKVEPFFTRFDNIVSVEATR